MSLRIAFNGGPLDGTLMTAGHEQPSSDVWQSLPYYVFRSTRHGRIGASFDIFHPAEFPAAAATGRTVPLHHYRIDRRHIGDDATIQIQAKYVGVTGRGIPPTLQAIRQWAGLGHKSFSVPAVA
jgi:hypothetical protein